MVEYNYASSGFIGTQRLCLMVTYYDNPRLNMNFFIKFSCCSTGSIIWWIIIWASRCKIWKVLILPGVSSWKGKHVNSMMVGPLVGRLMPTIVQILRCMKKGSLCNCLQWCTCCSLVHMYELVCILCRFEEGYAWRQKSPWQKNIYSMQIWRRQRVKAERSVGQTKCYFLIMQDIGWP